MGVKHLVIRVVNEYTITAFSLYSDKALITEINQFLIVTVSHKYTITLLRRSNGVGNKVHSPLNRVEIAFAVGRYG